MKKLRQFAKQSPLLIFGVSLFIAGAVLGAVASAWLSAGSASQLRASLAESNGREQALTELLRSALANQIDDGLVAKLDSQSPVAAPIAASAPTATAVNAAASATSDPARSMPNEAASSTAPSTKVAAATPPKPAAGSKSATHPPMAAATPPKPEVSTKPASAPATSTVEPVPAAVALAPVANSTPPTAPNRQVPGRLEAVSAAKAEVAGLDKAWVRMNSGLTIHINEKFPSGETLIAVDPAKSQIVTDRRVLLIL